MNIYRGVNSGTLARLTVDSSGTAEGRILSRAGSFMPARAFAQPGNDHTLFGGALGREADARRSAQLPPEAISDHDFSFLVDFLVSVTELQWFTPSATGVEQTWLLSPDGSWACVAEDQGRQIVEQGGPQLLWDPVEELHQLWTELGRPSRDRFGLTAGSPALTLWLDTPDGSHTWPLPTTS